MVDWGDMTKLLSRLFLDLAFVSIIIRLVYFRLYRNREFVFTFYLFNVITFLLCLLLRKVPAELGFALAIFGVFGILRYRTEQIRNRDLTYLFIVIGLGLLNALSNKGVSLAELLTVNTLIVGLSAWLELAPSKTIIGVTPMLYDRLELLQPGHEEQLASDILMRTGHTVVKVDIHRVDLLRDAAEISVHHSRRSS
jgi:hypothetical protein